MVMHAVTGMILNAAGEVLIARRKSTQYRGGLWEFPGGKLEADENPFQALQRELKEETAIHVISAEHWCRLGHDYGDRVVLLDAWVVLAFEGKPHGAEDQPVQWIQPADLSGYAFPEGNRRLLARWQAESHLFAGSVISRPDFSV